MREKLEEFVANKKAAIELKDNATVKVAEPANDESMDFDNVFTFRKKEQTNLRPSDKNELDKEVVQVLTACDLLAEKNKKYHEDYVVRGTQALYGLLADIYAMGMKINLSYSKDNILDAMRRKLRDRGLRTNFNTPLMTTVIKYVVGAERQTAANYSRVLTIAMNARKWFQLDGNKFYNFEKGRALSNAITNALLLAMKWFPEGAPFEPMDPWDRAELLL